MKNSQIAKVISQAKGLLKQYGWRKGRSGYGPEPHCAAGALYDAALHLDGTEPTAAVHEEREKLYQDAIEAVTAYVNETWKRDKDHKDHGVISSIVNWNDDPDTTEDAVFAALTAVEEAHV